MSVRVSLAALLLFPLAAAPAPAQTPQHAGAAATPVHAEDIGRFWRAYDAVNASADPAEKLRLIESLYIAPGTPGLHALMQVRRYTAQEYIDAIAAWPRFWNSVRPLTDRATQAVAPLERDLATFRKLYPRLRPATVTYAIGVLRTGGTTLEDKVLIGAELALGDETVDVSELPEPLRTRLATFYRSRPFANNGQNNVHEYVHTQQEEAGETLAQYVAREGVAEFVAELITARKPALPFYQYGPANSAKLRDAFRAEMDGTKLGNWLYNSADNVFGVGDLGYYVGYEIARGYYARARDKKGAIGAMIELRYGDAAAVKAYIAASGYLDRR